MIATAHQRKGGFGFRQTRDARTGEFITCTVECGVCDVGGLKLSAGNAITTIQSARGKGRGYDAIWCEGPRCMWNV